MSVFVTTSVAVFVLCCWFVAWCLVRSGDDDEDP